MMNKMNVMVDIETMGLGEHAAMVSIGAVKYNDDGSGWETFYRAIDLHSSCEEGGIINPSTILWWLDQSKEAQQAFLSGTRFHVHKALEDFIAFYPVGGLFWGFGATFDNIIVKNAIIRSGLTPPWSYHNDRCFRTLVAEYPEVVWNTDRGVVHNALDDAISQARHHLRILNVSRQ